MEGSVDATLQYRGELTVVLKYIPEGKNVTPTADQVQGANTIKLYSLIIVYNSLKIVPRIPTVIIFRSGLMFVVFKTFQGLNVWLPSVSLC